MITFATTVNITESGETPTTGYGYFRRCGQRQYPTALTIMIGRCTVDFSEQDRFVAICTVPEKSSNA